MSKPASRRKQAVVPEAPGVRLERLQNELQGLPAARRAALLDGDGQLHRKLAERESLVRDEIRFVNILHLRAEGERIDRALTEVMGEREGLCEGMDELRTEVETAERAYRDARDRVAGLVGEIKTVDNKIASLRDERERIGAALATALDVDTPPSVEVEAPPRVIYQGGIVSGPRPTGE